MLLKDKVVIISGIGPGLGSKLAIQAALAGAKGVVLASRTQAKLDDVAEHIAQLNTSAQLLTIVTDICQKESCENLVAQTIQAFGRIDALVNSAYQHGNFEHIENADLSMWRNVMETNLMGTMQLTQAAIPTMKQQGDGAIVMINTQAIRKPVVLPMGGESAYAASKAALANTVKYLALELGQYGIRVNSALMGWMWGKPVQDYVQYMAHKRRIDPQIVINEIAANIALKRISTDDDCAKSALFLVSDYAKAITGASLDINGGEYLP